MAPDHYAGSLSLPLEEKWQVSENVMWERSNSITYPHSIPGVTILLLQVPCVAVVENMSFFEVDGVKHFPFGKGSGDRIVKDYGLSNLVRFPIVAELSAAGDGNFLSYRVIIAVLSLQYIHKSQCHSSKEEAVLCSNVGKTGNSHKRSQFDVHVSLD